MCSLLRLYSDARWPQWAHHPCRILRILSMTVHCCSVRLHAPPPSKSQGQGALSCSLSGRVRLLLAVRPFGDASADFGF